MRRLHGIRGRPRLALTMLAGLLLGGALIPEPWGTVTRGAVSTAIIATMFVLLVQSIRRNALASNDEHQPSIPRSIGQAAVIYAAVSAVASLLILATLLVAIRLL